MWPLTQRFPESQKLGFPSDLRTHLVWEFLSFSWSLHLHVIKLRFFSKKKRRHLVQPSPFTHGDIERKVDKNTLVQWRHSWLDFVLREMKAVARGRWKDCTESSE